MPGIALRPGRTQRKDRLLSQHQKPQASTKERSWGAPTRLLRKGPSYQVPCYPVPPSPASLYRFFYHWWSWLLLCFVHFPSPPSSPHSSSSLHPSVSFSRIPSPIVSVLPSPISRPAVPVPRALWMLPPRPAEPGRGAAARRTPVPASGSPPAQTGAPRGPTQPWLPAQNGRVARGGKPRARSLDRAGTRAPPHPCPHSLSGLRHPA